MEWNVLLVDTNLDATDSETESFIEILSKSHNIAETLDMGGEPLTFMVKIENIAEPEQLIVECQRIFDDIGFSRGEIHLSLADFDEKDVDFETPPFFEKTFNLEDEVVEKESHFVPMWEVLVATKIEGQGGQAIKGDTFTELKDLIIEALPINFFGLHMWGGAKIHEGFRFHVDRAYYKSVDSLLAKFDEIKASLPVPCLMVSTKEFEKEVEGKAA